MLKHEINHAFDLLKDVVIRINNNGKDSFKEFLLNKTLNSFILFYKTKLDLLTLNKFN